MKTETTIEKDWQPRPIREQVELISQEFDLSTERTMQFLDGRFRHAILPSEAQGWFALPTIEAVAERFLPDSKDLAEMYRKSTELALDKISKKSQEFGDLACKSTPEKFFLPMKTRLALEIIRINQRGDILILPVRFNTKINLGSNAEFTLGSFFTACLGLSHLERYSGATSDPEPAKTVGCIGFGPVTCRKCWFEDARSKWNNATGYIPRFTA